VDHSPYPERRLRRRVPNKMLSVASAMFCLSLFAAVSTGTLVGWFCVGVSGLALASLVLNRLRPRTLAIHPQGVERIGPLGGRTSHQYSHCGPFGVVHAHGRGGSTDWLTFDCHGMEPRTRSQRRFSKLTGANSQLRADGFELSPDEVAELLNCYRDAARSESRE
jgi:hypothetical protein